MTEFYGFPQGCPIMQQLIARSSADAATQPKRLYYVSEGAPLHTGLSRQSSTCTPAGKLLHEVDAEVQKPHISCYCQDMLVSCLPKWRQHLCQLACTSPC